MTEATIRGPRVYNWPLLGLLIYLNITQLLFIKYTAELTIAPYRYEFNNQLKSNYSFKCDLSGSFLNYCYSLVSESYNCYYVMIKFLLCIKFVLNILMKIYFALYINGIIIIKLLRWSIYWALMWRCMMIYHLSMFRINLFEILPRIFTIRMSIIFPPKKD